MAWGPLSLYEQPDSGILAHHVLFVMHDHQAHQGISRERIGNCLYEISLVDYGAPHHNDPNFNLDDR